MRINIGNLQVSGYQKKAVYTIWIILNLGIDNTGINIGCDFFTTEQLIKVFGNFRRSCLDNFSDYLIAAGGLPECFRKARPPGCRETASECQSSSLAIPFKSFTCIYLIAESLEVRIVGNVISVAVFDSLRRAAGALP